MGDAVELDDVKAILRGQAIQGEQQRRPGLLDGGPT
jgi:hypothetical protein